MNATESAIERWYQLYATEAITWAECVIQVDALIDAAECEAR